MAGTIMARDAYVHCAGCNKWESVERFEFPLNAAKVLADNLRDKGWSDKGRDRRWRCPECRQGRKSSK